MYKNKLEKIILLLVFLWMIVLVGRSIVYVNRIYKEFKYPVEPYYEYIDPCDENFISENSEEQKLYEYRKLGVECIN